MDFKQIKPEIDSYIKRLKAKMDLDKVFLYGSFAKGEATEESDVDLIVISSGFAEMDEDKRLRFLYRNSVGFPYNLHVYGITPQEYESASPLTTLGIVKNQAREI